AHSTSAPSGGPIATKIRNTNTVFGVNPTASLILSVALLTSPTPSGPNHRHRRCSLFAPFLRLLRKQWPEKRSFVAGEAARLPGESHGFLNVRIVFRILAVLFIGRQTRKAEHRQRYVALAFGWQKVAVMDATEPRHQVDPHGTVGLELGDLAQRDLITQIA